MITDEVPLRKHGCALPIVWYGSYESVYQVSHTALAIQSINMIFFSKIHNAFICILVGDEMIIGF
jgi:hypothetical protein